MVALLLPNLLLAFADEQDGWAVAAGVVLPLGLYMLTTLFTRRVSLLVLALVPLLALCAVQIVIIYLYGNSVVAVDMFTNIMTTNAYESSELLSGMVPIIVVVALLYFPLFYAAFRQLKGAGFCLSEPAHKRITMIGGVLTIVGVQLLNPAVRSAANEAWSYQLFPVNALHNLAIAVSNRYAVNHYERTSASFCYDAERTPRTAKREIYIYVIGESSRAQNWSLYGYHRTTNPRLSERDDIALFRNMITQSNTTHKSVPLMLSSVDAEEYDRLFERKGVAALFGEVGFRSYFISAQSPQGAMVDNLAKECDEVIYIPEPCFDGQLLNEVERVVETAEGENMLFILHCYGSHYRYNQRYTGEFALFQPDDAQSVHLRNAATLRNGYDNSILYTDYLLDGLAEYLGRVDACSAMLYCSDHGEGLFDDERELFLHASPQVSYYQLHVPALAWFSEEYRLCCPEKVAAAEANRWAPASTGAMFHTLADMASIQSPYLDIARSLVSADFEWEAPRRYLNDHNEAVALDYHIGITDLDRREFLLHGITLE